MPNAEGIGFRSAMIMAKMLMCEADRKAISRILIPPLGIYTRQSSDIVATDDADIAAALRFVRDNAVNQISVADIVNATGMSRSTLERKMRGFTGRTPQQEIRRVQLARVCTLLAGSKLSIESIAAQCGYEHPEYLHVVFKREIGMTPGEYRTAATGD